MSILPFVCLVQETYNCIVFMNAGNIIHIYDISASNGFANNYRE